MADIDLRITDKIAWLLSKSKRIKIAVGGRGSAKSIGVGDLMLMFCDNGERVCCTREFQNSIDESVHESLKSELDRLNLEGFRVTDNKIESASNGKIFYKGLARNITSLKSLSGVNKLWIEEGESVSERSLKVLTPSVRSDASTNESEQSPPEIWITMNRGSSADAIAKKYLSRADDQLRKTGYYEDDLIMVVEVNWRDNPWFPPELEQERQDDLENLSRAEYDHIWEGDYNDSVDNAIIKGEWFDAAIDAHKLDRLKAVFEPHGAVIAAHDPFDDGNDAGGFAVRHGSIIKAVKSKDKGEVDVVCDWAIGLAKQYKADWFIWDGDGMGTGLKRQVSLGFNGTKTQYQMFKGSLSGKGQDNAERIYLKQESDTKSNQTTYAETFKNNRAQYYVRLADRFYNTYRCVVKGEYVDPGDMISLDSEGIEDLKGLRSQLCRIPRVPNNNGLEQIMNKKEMKANDINSPNEGDSVMMTLFTPPVKKARKQLNYRKSGVV